MAVLRGAAGWIIRQAAAMQAAAGGRRWRARPPRWWRWRLRCCCEVWQVWQAVGAVQVGQGWRWCVVIVGGGLLLAWSSGAALAVLILPGAGGGRSIHALRPALPGYFPAFPRGGTTPSACRSADPAGRAGGQAGRRRKRKRPGRLRVVRCCSGLLSALAVRSAAPGASRCISWATVVCSPFRCRVAGAGTDPGATVPAGNVPAWHGLRWRCSIRCVFVPPPEGSDSPLYRVVLYV